MSKNKQRGSVAGDVLLWGGVGVGAFLLLKSLRGGTAVAAPAAPAAGSGGGILDAIFGALTGAAKNVAGAAQQTVSPAPTIDPSQIPAGAAASVGGAVSDAFGWLFGPPTPAQTSHEAQHATPTSGLSYELGTLSGTVFDAPTLPMRRGRMLSPGMTGRVPGRGARRYR